MRGPWIELPEGHNSFGGMPVDPDTIVYVETRKMIPQWEEPRQASSWSWHVCGGGTIIRYALEAPERDVIDFFNEAKP